VSVIVAERLTKRYGRRVGVADLNLSVGAGELFGFLGPNGSGKTTTIRLLLGLLKADAGGARIFGRDAWKDSFRVKRKIGYLPGDLRLYPWLTGRSALKIFGRARGKNLAARGLELAAQFELEVDLPVRRMSRGTRQKLGLILALAHEPQLLILDEPTTALDPLVQETLFAHLRRVVGAGRTVFFSSHTLSEVERLCDRVGILHDGRLVADETLATLRARARRLVTIRWHGESAPAGDPPAFLEILEQGERHWRAALTGPVTEFVRWCADQPIADLVVEQPDLAALFQQYYAAEKPR
jgi:ABC-2 type transport system ATP-binding protein